MQRVDWSAVVISVPRTVADNIDQSDDSSGPSPVDYSEKRSLPISIPDYRTVQQAGERYVVRIVSTFTFISCTFHCVCLLYLPTGHTFC